MGNEYFKNEVQQKTTDEILAVLLLIGLSDDVVQHQDDLKNHLFETLREREGPDYMNVLLSKMDHAQ